MASLPFDLPSEVPPTPGEDLPDPPSVEHVLRAYPALPAETRAGEHMAHASDLTRTPGDEERLQTRL